MSTTSDFTIEDVQRHVEKVQNELAKKEKRIILANPLLIGTCVRCGTPLVEKQSTLNMCSKCLRDTGHDVYEMNKRKRKEKSKDKKKRGRHIVHINQIKPVG